MNSKSRLNVASAGLAGVIFFAPVVANAVNLEAESVYPQILFDDTGHEGNEWAIVGLDEIFAIQDVGQGTTILNADPADRSVSVGYLADSNAGNSVAVGYNAETQGSFSVALGYNALTTGWSATALGRDAVAGGSSSVALGEGATTAGVHNFAAGYGALAIGERSAVLGWNATAEGDESLALGRNAITAEGASSSSAIGRGASAYGLRSLAVGNFARSDGSYSTAVGNARTQGADSVAIGREADTGVTGASGVAVGPYSVVSNTAGIAVGYAAGSFAPYSTAIGPYASTSESWSLVLGSIAGSNGAPAYTDVAIGTTAPLAPLHVARDDGTARLLVQENHPDPAGRTLFTLANRGNTKFEIKETGSGTRWQFTNSGDAFRISKYGTGEVEFQVFNDGSAALAGDLVLDGSLTEMSDRNQKHAIVPLTGDVVLAKLAQVPVSEWSYKGEPADSRHIGPMAQDFHAAFGLASGETRISARDMAGVNMAAVKALAEENRALKFANSELEERILRLEARAERLEVLAKGWLDSSGMHVAAGN